MTATADTAEDPSRRADEATAAARRRRRAQESGRRRREGRPVWTILAWALT